jgi:acyl-CoA synthetase (AMP-forming)/AMP-acid ligase II
VVFAPESVVRPSFWDAFRAQACTSFAGVPYTYAMLERVGFRRFDLPSLRTATQAGGRLDPALAQELRRDLGARGARFVVMYGQTEATARIAYVPPERLADKPGSIGVAIPGGRLAVEDDDGRELPAGEVGELVYRGPNVMLGYANGWEDLARGDELGGVLRTGDLGYRDDEGFHFLTGRRSRFAKVYGLRVNLDDVEAAFAGQGAVAAVGGEERIVVFREQAAADADAARRDLAERFRLHPRTFEVRDVERLPLTATGKVDYEALRGA